MRQSNVRQIGSNGGRQGEEVRPAPHQQLPRPSGWFVYVVLRILLVETADDPGRSVQELIGGEGVADREVRLIELAITDRDMALARPVAATRSRAARIDAKDSIRALQAVGTGRTFERVAQHGCVAAEVAVGVAIVAPPGNRRPERTHVRNAPI